MKHNIIIFIAILFSSNIHAASVFTEGLAKVCAQSLGALDVDPDKVNANQLIITKPSTEKVGELKKEEQLKAILNGVAQSAQSYESLSSFRWAQDRFIEKDIYSGKDTDKKISKEYLLAVLKKQNPSAHRIELAVEAFTGNVYALEIFDRYEFNLRNLTTSKVYPINASQIVTSINIFFSRNNIESVVNATYLESQRLALIGLGQTLFIIDFSKSGE